MLTPQYVSPLKICGARLCCHQLVLSFFPLPLSQLQHQLLRIWSFYYPRSYLCAVALSWSKTRNKKGNCNEPFQPKQGYRHIQYLLQVTLLIQNKISMQEAEWKQGEFFSCKAWFHFQLKADRMRILEVNYPRHWLHACMQT